jgi:ubiquinone biosynthesis protein COQ4
MQVFSIWRQQGRSALQALIYSNASPLIKLTPLQKRTQPTYSVLYATQARNPLESLREAFLGLIIPPKSNYGSHVPLSQLQKGALGILASLGAFTDPRRGDLVAVVGETTGVPALRAIRDRMLRSPEGRELLADRPRIANDTVAPCWDLPVETFGGAYAQFMGVRGFKANDRPTVRFVDDPELAWVAVRAREVHDFWHVLFNCHTNVFGETALKAVEFVQTGLPMTAMAVAAGQYRMKPEDRAQMNKIFLPWALRAGAQAADLMTIYYERHFDENLEELRKKWRIQPAPVVNRRQNAKPGSHVTVKATAGDT